MYSILVSLLNIAHINTPHRLGGFHCCHVYVLIKLWKDWNIVWKSPMSECYRFQDWGNQANPMFILWWNIHRPITLALEVSICKRCRRIALYCKVILLRADKINRTTRPFRVSILLWVPNNSVYKFNSSFFTSVEVLSLKWNRKRSKSFRYQNTHLQ